MKDLDFDELDKAVNSLMGGVKEKDNVQTSNTLDINPTLAPDQEPAYGTLSQVAEHIGSEAIDHQEMTVSLGNDNDDAPETAEPVSQPDVPPVSRPARSTAKVGRFMDVVHPSSDMKRPASSPKNISREGITIAAPTQPIEVALPPAPEVADTSGNLPSPSAPKVEAEEDKQESDSAPEPLSSPFLADAKVEKRPLGSESTSSHTPEKTPDIPLEIAKPPEEPGAPQKKDESSVMDNLTEPTKEEDNDVTVHVPEEFQDELLAVEKNTDPVGHKEQDAPTDPIAVASIPKQYQEKPSSGETKSGSIYDTDQYHKPLAHPQKKKSGWLWVVGIVVVIVLGAGAGALVYFLGR